MIELGPITLSMYGLLVGTGILAGFWVASQMARRLFPKSSKINPDTVWDAFWWVVIPGVLGARLYHVIDLWGWYRRNLFLVPRIWTGGMGILGAIIGGLIGLFVFVRKKEISFFSMADLIAFGLPLGQAIGRWGNFFNQELYGLPTNVFWGIYIEPENRVFGFESFERFHPLFLYESIYSLLVFGFLVLVGRNKGGDLPAGMYFSWYLISYGLGRYFLESMRIDPWSLYGIEVARIGALMMITSGGYIVYSIVRKKAHEKY